MIVRSYGDYVSAGFPPTAALKWSGEGFPDESYCDPARLDLEPAPELQYVPGEGYRLKANAKVTAWWNQKHQTLSASSQETISLAEQAKELVAKAESNPFGCCGIGNQCAKENDGCLRQSQPYAWDTAESLAFAMKNCAQLSRLSHKEKTQLTIKHIESDPPFIPLEAKLESWAIGEQLSLF